MRCSWGHTTNAPSPVMVPRAGHMESDWWGYLAFPVLTGFSSSPNCHSGVRESRLVPVPGAAWPSWHTTPFVLVLGAPPGRCAQKPRPRSVPGYGRSPSSTGLHAPRDGELTVCVLASLPLGLPGVPTTQPHCRREPQRHTLVLGWPQFPLLRGVAEKPCFLPARGYSGENTFLLARLVRTSPGAGDQVGGVLSNVWCPCFWLSMWLQTGLRGNSV